MAVLQPQRAARAPINIPGVVGQVVQTLQLMQAQTLPAPPNAAGAQVIAEIFGQSPGRFRLPGAGGVAVLTAWSQAVQSTAQAASQRYAILRGNGQSAPRGTALTDPLAIRVTDIFGRPQQGITVTFVASGGGTAPGSATTDATGVASPGAWTLGTTQGLYTLAAYVNNVPVGTFWAIAV